MEQCSIKSIMYHKYIISVMGWNKTQYSGFLNKQTRNSLSPSFSDRLCHIKAVDENAIPQTEIAIHRNTILKGESAIYCLSIYIIPAIPKTQTTILGICFTSLHKLEKRIDANTVILKRRKIVL